MEGVQGFVRSHWTPPLSEYSGRIAPTDNIVAKKAAIKAPYLLAVLLAVVMRQHDTKHITRWGGSRASTEATGQCHQASIAADSSNRSMQKLFFSSFFIVDPPKRGLG